MNINMKILHYSLGFPPYRRGGLTKYCIDLMCEQAKNNVVGMIWPGRMNLISKKSKIIKHKPYNICGISIQNYEIKGFLGVPLMDGINNVDYFLKKIDVKKIKKFLKKFKPDVIHFHTLMGLPYSFLCLVKGLGIKTVFTSHDYFGICPKATLFRSDGFICRGDDKLFCYSCNINAFSIKKMYILQSPFYRMIKDNFIIKKLRKKRWNITYNVSNESVYSSKKYIKKYNMLQAYYLNMLNSFNVIHFNSSSTESIYSTLKINTSTVIIPITNYSICNHHNIHKLNTIISISYMGPKTYHKGYYLLKEVCEKLYNEGFKFSLNVFFEDDNYCEFLNCHKPYDITNIEKAYSFSDYVVIPSIWNETFGFVVPEALSYGVPILVSSRVGSKDLIKGEFGLIFNPTKDSLYKCIKSILCDKNMLLRFRQNIAKYYRPKLMSEHSREILSLYQQLSGFTE